MKKIFSLLLIFLLVFCLSSCVDYVQSISYKNGNYVIYYKITLSKALFALANEDPEYIFKDFDESFEEFPENTDVKPVNTELEVGAEFTFLIDPKTSDETEKSFLPTVAANKYYIPFLPGENSSISDSVGSDNDSGEAFVQAILSSTKCRILIGKNVIPEIETAYFEGKGNQNYSIPVFDYGDSHCLEIPFIILFQKGMYRTDRVVVIKKLK